MTDPVISHKDGCWCGTWSDTWAVVVKALDASRVGSCRAKLELWKGETYLKTIGVDLLNSRSRDEFLALAGSLNGVAPIDWDERLDHFYRKLQVEQQESRTSASSSLWDQAETADAFLTHEEEDIQATVQDMLFPGGITLIAAPRASGKSHIADALAIALAKGGIFRYEHLLAQRVFLLDRDNPRALVRKRLYNLGALGLTTLKVLTREKAPALTDTSAWELFPAEEYSVVIVDSLGAFTEGVSEKEGKLTQQCLATLKNLAAKGLTILALDNTNKTGENIRGRGEKTDAVDIVYEARNVTGWTPTTGALWWEQLPEAGERAWQDNTTRQLQHEPLRLAFVATKFRIGLMPDPFVLELDMTTTPWQVRDVTTTIAQEGAIAFKERQSAERAALVAAAYALAQRLREVSAERTMRKREGEDFLRSQKLTVRQARNLLEVGFNADFTAEGLWVLRPIPGEKGNAIGVYSIPDSETTPVGEEDSVQNVRESFSASNDVTSSSPISDTRSTLDVQNTIECPSPISSQSEMADFVHPPCGPCPKSTPLTPAENLEENDRQYFGHSPHTPAGEGVTNLTPILHHPGGEGGAQGEAGEESEESPSPPVTTPGSASAHPPSRCAAGGQHTWIGTETGRLCSRCNAQEQKEP